MNVTCVSRGTNHKSIDICLASLVFTIAITHCQLLLWNLKIRSKNELKWGDIQLSWEHFWEMIKTPIWGREGGGRRNVLTFPVFLIKTRRQPLGDVYEGIHYIMLLLEQTHWAKKYCWGKNRKGWITTKLFVLQGRFPMLLCWFQTKLRFTPWSSCPSPWSQTSVNKGNAFRLYVNTNPSFH